MYLLDTMILSTTAPTKREAAPTRAAWIRQTSDRLFLSAVTVAEIEAGIARADRISATAKAARLRNWLAAVEHLYGDRISPFGNAEARHAGLIIDRARAHDPGFEDIAIAATAAAHGMTILTANERHFAPLGVPFLNPLRELPKA